MTLFIEDNSVGQVHPLQVMYNICTGMSTAGLRSAVGSESDSRARGPGLDTRFGYILSFLLPLIQEGQFSVTGESVCTKYCLTT